MELLYLIALLAVVAWFARGYFGFGRAEWMGADDVSEDGSRKWLCSSCGRVETTADGNAPAKCSCT